MRRSPGESLIIKGVRLSNTGEDADIFIKDGFLFEISSPGVLRGEVRVIDGAGHVLFPSFVEPHAHLDKVFILDEDIPPGDLYAAIGLFKRRYYSKMDRDDIYQRARAALKISISRGVTSMRTHIDIGASAGVVALEPILALKKELQDLIDLQVVALVLPPAAEEDQKIALLKAIELGVDALGGCPTLEDEPRPMVDWILRAARDASLPVDFHLDEAEGAESIGIAALLDSLDATTTGTPVVASHCVSLGSEPALSLESLLGRMRGHDIGVVTLPQTNLLLQSRGKSCSKPRGMPPLREILNEGITLGAGGDNWRDPFNPLSRIDPLEIVSLLVSAGHLEPLEALDLVTSGARKIMGLPEVRIERGMPADLVLLRGDSTWGALADASEQRIVIKNGAVISRTTVTQELHPLLNR